MMRGASIQDYSEERYFELNSLEKYIEALIWKSEEIALIRLRLTSGLHKKIRLLTNRHTYFRHFRQQYLICNRQNFKSAKSYFIKIRVFFQKNFKIFRFDNYFRVRAKCFMADADVAADWLRWAPGASSGALPHVDSFIWDELKKKKTKKNKTMAADFSRGGCLSDIRSACFIWLPSTVFEVATCVILF